MAIEQGTPPLWPLFVIRQLESDSRGKAMELVKQFVESCFHTLDDQHAMSIRQTWIRELREFTQKPPPFDEIIQRSRDVWYHTGDRDRTQTAVARLFEALAAFVRNEQVGYCKALAVAVIVVASRDDKLSPMAVRQFAEMYQSLEEAL